MNCSRKLITIVPITVLALAGALPALSAGEISGKVLCALGDFATSPVVATVKQYRAEYEQHVQEQRCPFEPW